MRIICYLFVAALFVHGFPVTAQAQISYGSWQNTNDCRTLRAPSGFGRGNIELPQAGGVPRAMECRWQRDVRDCPKIGDKLMHPIQCTRRRQISGYSTQPPPG